MIKRQKWVKRWNTWIAATPLQGVWLRKEGGHLVRARVVDPTTGSLKEVRKVLPDSDQVTAHQWLTEELARIRTGIAWAPPQQTRFGDFAVSLLERKCQRREIKSAKGRERWRYTLEHLIGGTTGEKSGRFVQGFGEFFLHKLHVSHVETWKTGIAGLITAGDYAPTTANSWLSILRVIMKAARREHQLKDLATDGVEDFDLSEHSTYTEEEPNALLPEEVTVFLGMMRELYPQHFAMTFCGFATGLRPSSLRPLRRRGPVADVLWDHGRLLVRRSQTLGDEVMNTTKPGQALLNHGASGADGRAGVARPDAAHHARTGGLGPVVPFREGQLPGACSAQQALRGRLRKDGLGAALLAARASSDVQRLGTGRGGRVGGHPQYQWPPHRTDAAPLLDGEPGRAEALHRQGDGPDASPRAARRWYSERAEWYSTRCRRGPARVDRSVPFPQTGASRACFREVVALSFGETTNLLGKVPAP